jgi:hypothetical protein
MVTVEVGGSLLEFREIFHGPQRAFGAVNLLIGHAAQAGGVQAEANSLRSTAGRGLSEQQAVVCRKGRNAARASAAGVP